MYFGQHQVSLYLVLSATYSYYISRSDDNSWLQYVAVASCNLRKESHIAALPTNDVKLSATYSSHCITSFPGPLLNLGTRLALVGLVPNIKMAELFPESEFKPFYVPFIYINAVCPQNTFLCCLQRVFT